jgi:hypothetical protein
VTLTPTLSRREREKVTQAPASFARLPDRRASPPLTG